jgi:hypothetical protein
MSILELQMHNGITPKNSNPRIAIELNHKTKKHIYIFIY